MKKKPVKLLIALLILLLVAGSAVVVLIKMKPVKELSFSKESGFYENDFTLKISSKKGATIYYTTDGSIPTTKSNVYKKPLKLKDRSPEPNVLAAEKNYALTSDYTPDKPMSFVPLPN